MAHFTPKPIRFLKNPYLAPCPFCASQSVAQATNTFGDVYPAWYFVECENIKCRAQGPLRRSARYAVKAWNAPRCLAPQVEYA